MKIELKEIREILNKSREESIRPVDDSQLLADMNDKFYNFGVDHMFYVVLNKLYDLDRISKEIEL
jgi:hypothetical protein